jgi:UDP-3-O-[3-hydroxymyristoyl] glucosamine N-acyltransferase
VALDWKTLHSLIGLEAPEGGLEDSVFTGVNSLKDALPGEISFLNNIRYYGGQLADTKASLVLVAEDGLQAPDNCHLIVMDDPSGAFTKIIDFFQSESQGLQAGISPAAHVAEGVSFDESKVAIGPGAVIEEGAVIGDGTSIGAGCLIGREVSIGRDCLLYPGSIVRDRCSLGNRVVLQSGAVIGSDGYGYQLVDGRHEKVPQVGIVEIGDDVEVGANSCIDRARFGKTLIGEGTKIDNLVQIAHNVTVGKHCLLVGQAGLAGSATLGNYVTIAAQSGVAGHIEIGDQIILAGQSGFLKSTDKPGVYMGSPARPMAEEQRKMASVARLPKLRAEFKALKKKLEEIAGE